MEASADGFVCFTFKDGEWRFKVLQQPSTGHRSVKSLFLILKVLLICNATLLDTVRF